MEIHFASYLFPSLFADRSYNTNCLVRRFSFFPAKFPKNSLHFHLTLWFARTLTVWLAAPPLVLVNLLFWNI